LYSHQVIESHEKQLLEAEESSIRRTEELMSLLIHKTPSHFNLFLSALRQSGQQQLADALEGNPRTDVNDENWTKNSDTCALQAKLAAATQLVEELKKTLLTKDDQLLVLTRRLSDQEDLTQLFNREQRQHGTGVHYVNSLISQRDANRFETTTREFLLTKFLCFHSSINLCYPGNLLKTT
jgi:hypothetical protein